MLIQFCQRTWSKFLRRNQNRRLSETRPGSFLGGLDQFNHQLNPLMPSVCSILPGQPIPDLERYMESITTRVSKIDGFVEAIQKKVPKSDKSEG